MAFCSSFFVASLSVLPYQWLSILPSFLSSFFLSVLPCGFLFFLPSFVASPTVSFRLAFSSSFLSSQLLSNTGRQNQTAQPNADNILHLIFTLSVTVVKVLFCSFEKGLTPKARTLNIQAVSQWNKSVKCITYL